mgnify:CR=1 FL=1
MDAIGGLDIEVPEEIRDSKYPTADYGTMELYIPAGPQHMDGELALQYARTRHGSSDFSRMARQQQLLRAAFDKALRLDIPLTRIPMILQLLGSSVQTDLTLQEIMALASAARNVDPANLRSGVIDGSMTTTVITPQGWMVEVADWAKVRALVDDLFPATPLVSPTAENIRILRGIVSILDAVPLVRRQLDDLAHSEDRVTEHWWDNAACRFFGPAPFFAPDESVPPNSSAVLVPCGGPAYSKL